MQELWRNNLLSISDKMNERMLIKKVRELIKGGMGEEQLGFRRVKDCVAQTFTLRLFSR